MGFFSGGGSAWSRASRGSSSSSSSSSDAVGRRARKLLADATRDNDKALREGKISKKTHAENARKIQRAAHG